MSTWVGNAHAQQSVRWNDLPIPKFQGLHHWGLGMDKEFQLTLYNGRNYLSMVGFKSKLSVMGDQQGKQQTNLT